jgi:hypothetical protein
MKVLFLAATPSDKPIPNFSQVTNEIRQQFSEVIAQPRLEGKTERLQIHFKSLDAQRWDNIIATIRGENPHILQLCGHADQDGIFFQDREGKSYHVMKENIADLFELLVEDNSNLRCVLLSGCWTEDTAKIVAQHVDCVIGMKQPITDRDVKNFCVQGRSVQLRK